nr:hypothetical protein [Bacillus mesophilus]
MFLTGILGFILLMMGPLVGGLIAFALIGGCIFRGLYLLQDLHKRLEEIAPKRDKVQKAIDNYLMEKENK